MIKVCMLQKCGASVYRPLEVVFKACLEIRRLSSERRKANVDTVHEKGVE